MELDLDSKEAQDIINQIPVNRRPNNENVDDKRSLEGDYSPSFRYYL